MDGSLDDTAENASPTRVHSGYGRVFAKAAKSDRQTVGAQHHHGFTDTISPQAVALGMASRFVNPGSVCSRDCRTVYLSADRGAHRVSTDRAQEAHAVLEYRRFRVVGREAKVERRVASVAYASDSRGELNTKGCRDPGRDGERLCQLSSPDRINSRAASSSSAIVVNSPASFICRSRLRIRPTAGESARPNFARSSPVTVRLT